MAWFGRRKRDEAKALSVMQHEGRQPWLSGLLRRTKFDYAREVGSGIDSSVVTAPVQWVQRAFPEGRLRVMRGGPDARQEVDNHELVQLVQRPNPYYGDVAMWCASILSWYVAGNVYWLKVRNGTGRVVELWFVPWWMIEPRWPDDGSEFISHYAYRPDSRRPPVRLEFDDVVHFRHGVDPGNLRMGLSPLRGTLREIFTDLEASNFVASLLRNMGVPGAVISPEGGAASPDDVEAVKAWFRSAFGGDRRGDPLVMGGPTKVSQFGFNPQQMDLSVARDVAEERVCACIGIPAAVVGFGAGLQAAKVGATMGELSRLAWTNGIIPLMRAFADELQRSFPELVRPGDQVEFDTDGVMALAEHRLTQATQWSAAVTGGWAMVAEARDAMGLDVDDSHRIFLRPFAAIETPAGAPPRAPEPNPEPDPEPEPKQIKADRVPAAVRTRGRDYVRRLATQEVRLAAAVEPRLKKLFADLGTAAAAAARPVLEAEGPVAEQRSAGTGETKVDDLVVGAILEQLELPLHQVALQRLYETHYLTVAKEVSAAGELLGLAADLPDPVARAVVAAGGRRSGLVDLSAQSRQALFDALAEGRAAGEGVDQLVARIRDEVGGGPWQSAETRARTIARTETKYAQNTSTIARAQNAGVERFMVFDGRLGPGRSTPSHIARDGTVVDANTAARMAAEEHPNGTLSFAPYFEEDE